MRILVVTVVHHPCDARIRARQIPAMLAAGHEVVYAAPFAGYDLALDAELPAHDLPRATGRARLRAMVAARRLVTRLADGVDIVLLHDPELLLATAGLGGRVPIVWDVHEDTAGALTDKPWLPEVLRRPVAAAVRAAERWAERRRHLLLAETAYQHRFRRTHPVVPNTPRVPADAPFDVGDHVIYVGRISRLRGAAEMIEAGRLLAGDVTVRLIGPADGDVRSLLEAAHADGHLEWLGFLPNEEALGHVETALAGLALLHDIPNYRVSLPTKVLEYLSRATPVITTPLPAAVELVERYDAGVIVPFLHGAAVAAAVRELAGDPARREAIARRGHAAVAEHHNWDVDGPAFVRQLEAWAR